MVTEPTCAEIMIEKRINKKDNWFFIIIFFAKVKIEKNN
jgi:hypothetical protein